MRDSRSAELLVDRHITTAWSQRGFDRIGHGVDAALKRAPSLFIEQNLLCHIVENPPLRKEYRSQEPGARSLHTLKAAHDTGCSVILASEY